MTGSEVWLRDQRLAPLAVSAFPAWLWSVDGAHILWANPTGAAMFGADPAMALAARKFDPGEPAALQVAELAATLKPGDVPRIERLRGFGFRCRTRAHLRVLARQNRRRHGGDPPRRGRACGS